MECQTLKKYSKNLRNCTPDKEKTEKHKAKQVKEEL